MLHLNYLLILIEIEIEIVYSKIEGVKLCISCLNLFLNDNELKILRLQYLGLLIPIPKSSSNPFSRHFEKYFFINNIFKSLKMLTKQIPDEIFPVLFQRSSILKKASNLIERLNSEIKKK